FASFIFLTSKTDIRAAPKAALIAGGDKEKFTRKLHRTEPTFQNRRCPRRKTSYFASTLNRPRRVQSDRRRSVAGMIDPKDDFCSRGLNCFVTGAVQSAFGLIGSAEDP